MLVFSIKKYSGQLFFCATRYPCMVLLLFFAAANCSKAQSSCDSCVADMHYHISMRAYHKNGLKIIEGDIDQQAINIYSDKRLKFKYNKYFVRPKKQPTNAHLGNFSQATLPHTRDGNVKLIFNAISPFEYNLNDERFDRLINSLFKTRAKSKWLGVIGNWDRLNHFEGYKKELEMLTRQESRGVDWQYWDGLKDNVDWSKAVVVNVLEGGHALQGRHFRPDYQNAPGTFPGESDRFFDELQKEALTSEDVKRVFELIAAAQSQVRETVQKYKKQIKEQQKEGEMSADINPLPGDRNRAISFVAERIRDELIGNIKSIKDNYPPVFMVTVGHLSYNGMTGHAPALDGNGITRGLLRRFYRTRVSNDKVWRRNWNDKFFSPTIPTYFGKLLIDSLVSNRGGTHRIYIDLKHSSYPLRQWFYDSLACKEKIPPICSHCAVNGLSKIHYSVTTDEYAYADSRQVTNFYPLSINLYNEEITAICKLGGLIGLTLEERVLGGYMNNPVNVDGKKQLRRKANRTFLKKLRENGELDGLLREITLEARREPFNASLSETEAFKILLADYQSIEPFLSNLFHVLDYSQKGKDGWNHVCIGSDFDGFIDPLDLVPTASQYPYFKRRMRQFIPLFLHQRDGNANAWQKYYNNADELTNCLNRLFYVNLQEFVVKWFKK